MYDLERFVTAQRADYDRALREIQDGYKYSHWIWYIFPQLKGLSRGYNSNYYGIENLEEAKQYLNHPVLGPRLLEITKAFLDCEGKSADGILGHSDAIKVKASMTLFHLADPEEKIFTDVLDKYYNSCLSKRTLAKLGIAEEE